MLLENNWLYFFLQVLNRSVSTSARKIHQKLLTLFWAVESSWTWNARKIYLSWLASIFKLIVRQLYLLHCFIKVSKGRIILEATYSFLKNTKFVVRMGIGILISQKGQNFFQFRLISILQLILLGNYSIDCSFQSLNRRFSFRLLLIWNIPYFFPYTGTLIGQKRVKFHLIIHFVNFQARISARLSTWYLPTKSSYRFFVNSEFFCKRDLLFLPSVFLYPIDKKYRSATSPFVSYLIY